MKRTNENLNKKQDEERNCMHNHKGDEACTCSEHHVYNGVDDHNHSDYDCACGNHNKSEETCTCGNHNISDETCACGEHDRTIGTRRYKMCVLEENRPCVNCGACDVCDLDPTKICDNCGKCLDTLSTNEKGFVEIPVDKIIMGESEDDELESLLKLYGLDDEEDADEDNE